MTDSWIPEPGDSVRVVNPARGTYGCDGTVIRVNKYSEQYRDVLVRVGESDYIYELDEIWVPIAE